MDSPVDCTQYGFYSQLPRIVDKYGLRIIDIRYMDFLREFSSRIRLKKTSNCPAAS
jgi:hypothetical protein